MQVTAPTKGETKQTIKLCKLTVSSILFYFTLLYAKNVRCVFTGENFEAHLTPQPSYLHIVQTD